MGNGGVGGEGGKIKKKKKKKKKNKTLTHNHTIHTSSGEMFLKKDYFWSFQNRAFAKAGLKAAVTV